MARLSEEEHSLKATGVRIMGRKTGFLVLAAFGCLMIAVVAASTARAAQSAITEAEGYACMGDDKSKKQTEAEAFANAKRKAAESAATYIKSETRVKDLELEQDLIKAYANATVKVIQELEKGWYREPSLGDCYRVRIKAEVIPDDRALAKIVKQEVLTDDPSAPLKVRVWTDKPEYRHSEKIKIFIRGNKPFYARILYRDTKGSLLQLLPNPYRSDNYFQGGVVYEIPSGNDRFEMEVSPPFGEEKIIVYAGSSPLGEIGLQDAGAVYEVTTKAKDVGRRTRGIQIVQKGVAPEKAVSEFVEEALTVKTSK